MIKLEEYKWKPETDAPKLDQAQARLEMLRVMGWSLEEYSNYIKAITSKFKK